MKNSESKEILEAVESGRTVLVKMSANWCGPCKSYSPVFESFVEESKAEAYAFDIESDEGGLVNKYDVRGIPATLIFSKGKVVERLKGIQDKTTLNSLYSKYN